MARIRSIKPSFFTDAKICRLSVHARLLFVATWTIADDADGVFDARLSILKSSAFLEDPFTHEQISVWFAELVAPGLVWVFEDQGVPYGVVRHWGRHQVIHKPAKKVNPEPPQESPGKLQESPGIPVLEGKGREGKGVGGGSAPESSGASPEPPPPPTQEGSAPSAPSGQERPPFVRQIWARCLETIVPAGAPRDLDDDNAAAIDTLLSRRGGDPEFARARLFELLGQIAKSDKHGTGGSFVIKRPLDLLRPSRKNDPKSELVIEEMEGKFKTALETPERRARRERFTWLEERRAELETALRVKKDGAQITVKQAQDIREQAEIEWAERARAGPGAAPPRQQAGEHQQQAKEG